MMYCPIRRVGSTRELADDIAADTVDLLRPAPSQDRRTPDRNRVHLAVGRRSHPAMDSALLAATDERALTETLALLEAAAIALGAAALSAASIRTARAADRELRACRHDPTTAVRWARLFHHTLLGACPNRHLLGLIDLEAHGGGACTPTPSVGPDELSRVSDDHEAILDMIASGAPRTELERSLRRHASTSTLCSVALLGS